MRRREFIMLLGTAAAWPLAARAATDVPLIGFLSPGSLETDAVRMKVSGEVSLRSAMLRDKTWRSNIAGRDTNTINFRRWHAISSTAKSA